VARARRPAARSAADLARGPAKLAGILGLTGADTGSDLCGPTGVLRVRPPAAPVPDALVSTGPRVGVAAAGDWPWRLWLAGDPTVSGYRPAVRRTRRSLTTDTG
jgi:DNA-3-methyladenine glycosylase